MTPREFDPMIRVRLRLHTGGSASGKSELASLLVSRLSGDAVLVSQDWYYHNHSALARIAIAISGQPPTGGAAPLPLS